MKRVLIIEDDRDIVELVRYNLANEGFEVTALADGSAGLSLLRKSAPDLVILDLMLPKMPGLEVCTDVSDLYQFSHSAAEENAALRQGKLAKMGGGAEPAIRSIRWTLSCRRDVDRW